MSTAVVTAPRAVIDRETYRRLAARARILSWASLLYMTVEGAVAILAGVLAGSVALIGFGIDSAIEGFASAIIVWRFTGARLFSEHAELARAADRRGAVLHPRSIRGRGVRAGAR